MHPVQISHDLRLGRSEDLRRRRAVVGLSLLAAGTMGVVALYQTGIIRHLPEPRMRRLDADKVDASQEAYSRLSAPDALIGLKSYALTATLAAMDGANRAERRPWIPLALAGKAAIDAAMAAKLTWDQWAKHRAFCSWCLTAAAATFAVLPLVVPEARRALHVLKQRQSGPRPADRGTSAARQSRYAVACHD